MTPKEKARELHDKFIVELYPREGLNVAESYSLKAKKLALIGVDEILSMGLMSNSGEWNMAKSYWVEVKTELENLQYK